mmetsp:Transcript_32755/g.51199  ORF Transcript_32755/g.51199 Transcript_32755/m.51199 type:complete len:319 (-) Transcript_32755:119-1075(-)
MLRSLFLSSSRLSSSSLLQHSRQFSGESHFHPTGDVSSFKNIKVDVQKDGVAVVSLSGKPVNSFDYTYLCELGDLWSTVRAREDIKGVLVKQGEGTKAFSAGLNLKFVHAMCASADRQQIESFFRQLDTVFRKMIQLPKPIACVVAGHSIAGGTIFNMASDHNVLAAKNDKSNGGFLMGLTELRVGVPFPSLPFLLAERQLSPPSARLLTSGADLFSALDSFELGVGQELVAVKGVHNVQESPLVHFTEKNTAEVAEEKALEWLHKILSRPAPAFASCKAQWWRNISHSYPPDSEYDHLFQMLTSDECVKALHDAIPR